MSITVQRGSTTLTGGSTTQAPGTNFGSMNSTIVWNRSSRFGNTGPLGSSANETTDTMSGAIELTAVDTITFTGETSGPAARRYDWESWEYTGDPGGIHEFIVRDRVAVSVTAGSNTATISGVTNAADVVPIITGIRSTLTGSTAYGLSAIATLTNATTLNVEATQGTGTTTVYVTIVEFTGSAWTVSRGRVASAADSGTFNVRDGLDGLTGTIETFTTGSDIITHGHYLAGDTTNVAIADHWPIYSPSGSAGEYTWTFNGNQDGTAAQTMFVHVLKNALLTVARYTDSTSHTNDLAVGFSPAVVDLATASITAFRTTSGSGTAYGRGWVSARLTATNEYTLWAHRDGNTISTTVEIADLTGLATEAITDVDGDNQVVQTQTGVILTGFGFEAVQGTGKLEMWSDITGTTKVSQSITSWSDTSITFDVNRGSISNNQYIYFVVTTDAAAETSAFEVYLGLSPVTSYNDIIANTSPQHRWRFNNTYLNEGSTGSGSSLTTAVQGTGGSFPTTPICEDVTHSWLCDGRSARESVDMPDINLNITTARAFGGWYMVNQICKDFTTIYKEGGPVNNLCLLMGMGNVIVAQFADTSDDNAQSYSNFKLTPSRPYHLFYRFDYNEAVPADRRFELYIDGRLQTSSAGNPLTATDLDAHNGDIVFGGLDGSIEVGGTDVLFTNQESGNYNEWLSYDGVTLLVSPDDILNKLFRRGAIPTATIASDTEANMQTALDALSGTSYSDVPLAIRVERYANEEIQTDITLTADNITFDARVSDAVEYQGIGTLTWINTNGSNLTSDKAFASNGGSITIINPATVTLTGLQNNTEVRIYQAGTQTEVAGQENVTTGTFSASVQVTSVDIVIHAINYQNIRLESVDTTSDVSLPITQRFDRNYSNQ